MRKVSVIKMLIPQNKYIFNQNPTNFYGICQASYKIHLRGLKFSQKATKKTSKMKCTEL